MRNCIESRFSAGCFGRAANVEPPGTRASLSSPWRLPLLVPVRIHWAKRSFTGIENPRADLARHNVSTGRIQFPAAGDARRGLQFDAGEELEIWAGEIQ